MATLGNIDKIAYKISNSALKTVKALHVVAYGNEGESRKIRKALRAFSGFEFDKDSDEYSQKVREVKEKLNLPDLISICCVLDLDYTGSNEDIVSRICSFMTDLQVNDNKDEEDEEDEEDGEDGEDGEDEQEVSEEDEDEAGEEEETNIAKNYVDVRRVSRREKTARETKKNSFALTFRDVEDSIRPFCGDDDYPVEKWISDFEEIAEVTEWNELQKLIFAKRSLKGLAKMFVQSGKGIKSWSTLRNRIVHKYISC